MWFIWAQEFFEEAFTPEVQIKETRGEVFLILEEQKKPLEKGSKVQVPAVIETGKKSWVLIEFPTGSTVRVGESSRYELEEMTEAGEVTTGLPAGSILAKVLKAKHPKFEVKTITAVVGVRGTEFGIAVEEGRTQIFVYEGTVNVFNPLIGTGMDVIAGNYVVSSAAGITEPVKIPKKEEKKFKKSLGETAKAEAVEKKEELAQKPAAEEKPKEEKAKEEKPAPSGGKIFSPAIAFGSENVGGVEYKKVALKTDIGLEPVGIPLGFGLDIVVRWNDDGIRKEDWDFTELQTWINLIRYIRWGQKGTPSLYFKIGLLEDSYLGHGFIMKNYYNLSADDMAHKIRKVGLEFCLDKGIAGFEFITNSLLPAGWDETTYESELVYVSIPELGLTNEPVELQVQYRIHFRDKAFRLLGGRVFVRPLYNTRIPVVKNLELGVSGVIDLAPQLEYDYGTLKSEKSGDTYILYRDVNIKPAGESLWMAGADIGIPIPVPVINPLLYGDCAYLMDPMFKDVGETQDRIGFSAPGIRFNLPLGFYLFGEYRNFGKLFIYAPFDSSYETWKLTEKYAETLEKRQGFYAGAGWSAGCINLVAAYQHMTGEISGLIDALDAQLVVDTTKVALPSFLGPLANTKELLLFYHQRDIKWGKNWWVSPSTRFGVKYSYSAGGMLLTFEYICYYSFVGNEWVLRSSTNFETGIQF